MLPSRSLRPPWGARALTPQPPSHAQQTLASSSMPNLQASPNETSPASSSSSKKFKFKMPWKRDEDGVLQMRDSAVQALGVLEKIITLAKDVSSVANVPGLSAGLSGVAEVLRGLQTMSTTIKGVDTLKTRIEELSGSLDDYDQLPRDRPMPEAMRSRLVALVREWAEAGIDAHGIKRRPWVKRLWRSDADAAELQGLVDKINTSISEFMLQAILVVEENVLHMREDVAAMTLDVSELGTNVDDVLYEVEGAREDVEELREDVQEVAQDIEDVREDVEEVLDRVLAVGEMVQDGVDSVHEDVLAVQGQIALVGEGIEDVVEGVNDVQENVAEIKQELSAVTAHVAAVSENVELMKQRADAMVGEMQEMQKSTKAAKANLEGSFLPGYARKAQFDANGVRHGCLENTRVDLLDRLHQWIARPTGDVLWINGPAGTGKTTVAYSIAASSKKQDILAASFFCSRADAECSDAERIIPTIVRQLCRYHAPYREAVEAVLQQDPDVVHLKLESQFEKLVVVPLEALKAPFPQAVVVIDALDECKDKSAASTILEVLAKFISRIKDYLLFLVTSRPEPHITAMFSKAREDSLANATTLFLHEETLQSVEEDIRRYFVHEFRARIGTRRITEEWPSAKDLNTLVAMSHGLFIWAVTAVLLIMASGGHPPQRMRSLIDRQAAVKSAKPNTALESLYKQISEDASLEIHEDDKGHFQLILGTIAVAQEPLSVDALAALLGMDDGDVVYNLLVGMHSVLFVPDSPSEPVRVIHPTFPEYLLEGRLEKPDAFRVDAPTLHCTLFSRSLVVMDQLKYDICGIGDPLRLKAEMATLGEDVARCIPPHLHYACLRWEGHLQDAMGSSDLEETAGSFRKFLDHHLLNWLEACSLSGSLDVAVNALDGARGVFQSLGTPFAELILLITDCHRFLLKFIKCIDMAPLQAYHSVLALAPSLSHVKQIYDMELGDSVVVCSGGMRDWGTCLDVFPGNAGFRVFCIAFSPDGTCFATGGEDNCILIRRSTTRTLLLSIGGHTGDVTAMTFSSDGSHIASGSSDKTVGVWRVISGDRVFTLEGHTGPIYSVAYSKDGGRILSASRNEVILWDASDGCHLLTLPTTNAETWQAALSPEAGVIAHRDDSGLRLYNVASETGNTLALPGPAHAAAFSPDGRYIAAASQASICIWTAAKLAVVRSIDVPAFPFRLAFSHDGTRIACGLNDYSVCVWQVQSQEPPHVFRGHTERVYDVAWSPDDAQIASASGDTNVRIWDPTRKPDSDVQWRPHKPTVASPDSRPSTLLCRGDSIDIIRIPTPSDIEQLQTPDAAPRLSLHSNIPDAWEAAHSGAGPNRDLDMSWCMRSRDWELLTGQRHVQTSWRPVAISHDFSHMAYLSEGTNTDVHVCNLRTGAVAAELTAHTDNVYSIAFSSDGALIATGSYDKTVRLWNVASGALVATHTEHTERLYDTAFSPGDRLVVSGSGDRTARIYDIATGCVMHILRHPTTVMKVAFSVDNKHVLTLDMFRHVSIWDLSQTACIYTISLGENTWPRSLDFTPDGASILIRNPDGQALMPFAIDRPSERTWPTYHVSDEGWVTAVSPGKARRVCWLLPEWRAIFPLGGPRFCALDLDRKMSVVFDVSQTKAYAETWGDS